MVNSDDSKFNLFPLIVHFIVTEERASFHDILMQVEKTTGRKFDPTTVFSVVSKLVEYKILKLNEDTTGTFSLQDWKLQEE